ncbi:UNVERIFIED_CONTAM: hypothetical protein NCL1_14371 [Trichonephila clavipes]
MNNLNFSIKTEDAITVVARWQTPLRLLTNDVVFGLFLFTIFFIGATVEASIDQPHYHYLRYQNLQALLQYQSYLDYRVLENQGNKSIFLQIIQILAVTHPHCWSSAECHRLSNPAIDHDSFSNTRA